MAFQQVTIVGTGLIGGSLGLALKVQGLARRVVGCDRTEVLDTAKAAGVIDDAQPDLARACAGSDIVVLATPVGTIIDMLPRVAGAINPNAVVTDVGSTKREICAAAEKTWGEHASSRFLPGHPMAGKAEGGIQHATATLFKDAPWLFALLDPSAPAGMAAEFLAAVKAIGARPITCDIEEHDRVCAYVSHLPQMMATALANVVWEAGKDGLDANDLAGAGLRSMTRLASSPYSMWRDIALTNTDNIEAALLKMEQKLAHIRENLKSPELRSEFEKARAARAMLK